MSASTKNPYSHYRLVHSLKRRVRVIVPSIKGDFERSYVFVILLRRHKGILNVRAVPEIASVEVYYDPRKLPSEALLILLDALIANLGKSHETPSESLSKPAFSVVCADVPMREFNLSIEGMTCPACALFIEVRLRRDPRIATVQVNFATATAVVKGQLGKTELFEKIDNMGYKPISLDTLTQRKLLVAHEKERLTQAKHRAFWSNFLNLPALAITFSAPHTRFLHWLEFGFTLYVALWAGRPFFTKAWSLYSKHRSAGMDTLVAVAVGLAYSQGLIALLARRPSQYFQAAAGIVSFVLLGRYLEERARARTHQAIRRLLDGQPHSVTLLEDGRECYIPIDDLQVGDVVLVHPGERIPADGVVTEGVSSINEALLTGESMAVVKNPGSRVIGGCINGSGALQVTITAVGTDTVLAGIIQCVDQAQNSKLPVQAKVDRVSTVFMPGVIAVSGLTFFGWLLAGAGLERAVNHAISVLLVACPCALGMATPAAVIVGTGEASRRGIFIRHGASLETATQLSVLVFDKTGTITEGKPWVAGFANHSGEPDGNLLAWAAAAETQAAHYLGHALIEKALAEGLDIPHASDFANAPGRGIYAKVEGRDVLIGSQSWLDSHGIGGEPLAATALAWALDGMTPIYMAVDGKAVALFAMADRPRADAQSALANLHRLRIKTLMVTGDTLATAESVARQVGIDRVIAQATPERKLEIIRELQLQGGKVGMVGDGINDAPALAAADVGFAVGSDTDLAMEACDIHLPKGDIGKVAETILLGNAMLRVVRQNLVWAFGYNSIAIPLAALGKLNPLSASIAMSVSSLALMLNALRLQKKS